jgi:hypothetical protein
VKAAAIGQLFLREAEFVSPLFNGDAKTVFDGRFAFAFDALIGIRMETIRLQDLSDNF